MHLHYKKNGSLTYCPSTKSTNKCEYYKITETIMQLLLGNVQIATKTNKDTKYKLILKLATSNVSIEMILIDTYGTTSYIRVY